MNNEFITANDPDIYINRENLTTADSCFNELTRSGKAIYRMLRTCPVRNTHVLVECMENTYINMDWYPKEILKQYDTIPQYYAACILHVLDYSGYVPSDVVREVKTMLRLSNRQESIIWN